MKQVAGDRSVACHFADELDLTGFSRGGMSRLPIHSALPNIEALIHRQQEARLGEPLQYRTAAEGRSGRSSYGAAHLREAAGLPPADAAAL